MIELDHLTKTFGPKTAVNDVSFTVSKGEVLGFLGPNGAGKTTTMRMITGFLAPSAGTARVCGYDVRTDPVRVKSSLGYLPEGAPAWPDMTPSAFLRFAASIRGFAGKEVGKRVEAAAEKANLSGVMAQPIGTLSKGYKRRVGLAQALLHDPAVLIMDEPTDGLDPNQKHEVRKLIEAMRGEKAIIVSTHILEEVEAVCSRAIVIAGGRVVADETPAALEARSERHNGVWVGIDGDPATAKAVLENLPEVSRVDMQGDRLFCVSRDRGPIANAVSQGLRDNGLTITALQLERGRLDDVFREITQGATAGPLNNAKSGGADA